MIFWIIIFALSLALVVWIVTRLTRATAPDGQKSTKPPIIVSALIVFSPVIAAVIYMIVGRPDSLSPNFASSIAASESQPQSMAEMAPSDREAMINNMVTQLADRLSDNPDDIDGWRMLGRSYAVLGRLDDSAFGLPRSH